MGKNQRPKARDFGNVITDTPEALTGWRTDESALAFYKAVMNIVQGATS